MLEIPTSRGVSVAFAIASPAWCKERIFLFLATIAPFFQGVVRYWQGDVRVSVRPRLLVKQGSVALPFLFAALNNPNFTRCPMSFRFLAEVA